MKLHNLDNDRFVSKAGLRVIVQEPDKRGFFVSGCELVSGSVIEWPTTGMGRKPDLHGAQICASLDFMSRTLWPSSGNKSVFHDKPKSK